MKTLNELREELRAEFKRAGLVESDAMNLLLGYDSSRGVISDNCVGVDDIAFVDLERAVRWMKAVNGKLL